MTRPFVAELPLHDGSGTFVSPQKSAVLPQNPVSISLPPTTIPRSCS
jgi:hypothetical protein